MTNDELLTRCHEIAERALPMIKIIDQLSGALTAAEAFAQEIAPLIEASDRAAEYLANSEVRYAAEHAVALRDALAKFGKAGKV